MVVGPQSDCQTFRRSLAACWKAHRTTLHQVRSLVLGRKRRYLLAENSNYICQAVRFPGTSLLKWGRAAELGDGDSVFRRWTAADDTVTQKLAPQLDPRDRK